MINKDKVNEILADMKEEERKKQEAIEAEVAKFLEGRLEYYVAMVLNGRIHSEQCLMSVLCGERCADYNVAKDRINKALEEYDWYLCLKGRYDWYLHYMNIRNIPINIPQPKNVENRQIELGVRTDPIKAMEREHQRVRDEIEWNRKYHENYRKLFSREKQKTTNNRLKILAYFLIVVSITLFAFLK